MISDVQSKNIYVKSEIQTLLVDFSPQKRTKHRTPNFHISRFRWIRIQLNTKQNVVHETLCAYWRKSIFRTLSERTIRSNLEFCFILVYKVNWSNHFVRFIHDVFSLVNYWMDFFLNCFFFFFTYLTNAKYITAIMETASNVTVCGL